MTKEDIIRMAREAGLIYDEECTSPWVEDTNLTPFLECFAALIAKHTLANIDPSSFMSWQEGYEAGKQTEREACAKIADENATDLSEGDWDSACNNCADLIRARGQA